MAKYGSRGLRRASGGRQKSGGRSPQSATRTGKLGKRSMLNPRRAIGVVTFWK